MPAEKRSISAKVVHPNGKRASFTELRLDTEVTKASGDTIRHQLAKVTDSSGEDTYTFRFALKDPNARLWLVLVDEGKEESKLIVENQHRYEFGDKPERQSSNPAPPSKIVFINNSGTVNMTDNTTNPPPNSLSPLEVLNQARKAVPALDYALGAAGLAAAGAIATGFLGNTRGAVIIGGVILIAMVLIYTFARLAASKSAATTRAGLTMMWMVIVFFGCFLAFTVTAFAFRQPEPWAEVLGIRTSKGSTAEAPTIDDIKRQLVGNYQVVLGPLGGCGDGKPNQRPAQLARIWADAGNLRGLNECGEPTSVTVNSMSEISIFGKRAILERTSDGLLRIISDDKNQWWKVP